MRLPPARATITICAITGLAFCAALLAGQTERVAMLAGFIPARLTDGLPLAGAVPVWLTPISATLVHLSLWNVVFSLLLIGFCGRLVEAAIGPGGLVAMYVAGAYLAAGAAWAVQPHGLMPMMGAFGAGSAFIGAYALLYGQRRVRDVGRISGQWVQVAWLACAWIVLQALAGFASGGLAGVLETTPGCVGGFVAGMALARPLLLFRYRKA